MCILMKIKVLAAIGFLIKYQDFLLLLLKILLTVLVSFPKLLPHRVEELDDVEGIGEVRAKKIKEGFKLIKERLYTDRHL